MPKKRKNKMYLVLCKKSHYTQGAFPYTEEGKSKAEAFVKKAYRDKKEKLEIQEQCDDLAHGSSCVDMT